MYAVIDLYRRRSMFIFEMGCCTVPNDLKTLWDQLNLKQLVTVELTGWQRKNTTLQGSVAIFHTNFNTFSNLLTVNSPSLYF